MTLKRKFASKLNLLMIIRTTLIATTTPTTPTETLSTRKGTRIGRGRRIETRIGRRIETGRRETRTRTKTRTKTTPEAAAAVGTKRTRSRPTSSKKARTATTGTWATTTTKTTEPHALSRAIQNSSSCRSQLPAHTEYPGKFFLTKHYGFFLLLLDTYLKDDLD